MIRKIPWWAWIAAFVFILFLWQQLSGWAMSRKLYNMALDNLRTDQSRIVKTFEENQKMYEEEINRLNSQLDIIQKQKAIAQMESERLRGLVHEKDVQILALQKEREIIVVPADPNILADEFRKRGYQPRVMFPH